MLSNGRFVDGEVQYYDATSVAVDLGPFLSKGVLRVSGADLPEPLVEFPFRLVLPDGAAFLIHGKIIASPGAEALIEVVDWAQQHLEAVRRIALTESRRLRETGHSLPAKTPPAGWRPTVQHDAKIGARDEASKRAQGGAISPPPSIGRSPAPPMENPPAVGSGSPGGAGHQAPMGESSRSPPVGRSARSIPMASSSLPPPSRTTPIGLSNVQRRTTPMGGLLKAPSVAAPNEPSTATRAPSTGRTGDPSQAAAIVSPSRSLPPQTPRSVPATDNGGVAAARAPLTTPASAPTARPSMASSGPPATAGSSARPPQAAPSELAGRRQPSYPAGSSGPRITPTMLRASPSPSLPRSTANPSLAIAPQSASLSSSVDVRKLLECRSLGGLFAALGVHYSAGPSEIRAAFERTLTDFGPGSTAHRVAADDAQRIVQLATRAWEGLRERKDRDRYRREVLGVNVVIAARLMFEQSRMASECAEWRLARDLIEAALDLHPLPQYEAARDELAREPPKR